MVFLRGLFTVGGIIAFLAYGVFGAIAFMDGIGYLLGWGTLGQALSLIAVGVTRITILAVPFIFYGAWKIWHWHPALAAIFAMPALLLMVVAFAGYGVTALIERFRS